VTLCSIVWLAPSALWWLVPIALLWAWGYGIRLGRRRAPRRGVPFAPACLFEDEALPVSPRVFATYVPRALELAGLVLIVLAIARPAERRSLPAERLGIDMLLVLDVSSSMQQQDLAAGRSRLAVATDAARRFAEARDGDRIGLVSFAAYPRLVCPPTLDHAALGEFLDALLPVDEDGPEDRTAIGAATAHAGALLAGSDAPSRVVVLLTDGEENVARADTPDEIDPAAAARVCRELGARVYGVQLGERARGPGARPIDTAPMQALAETTGGSFLRAREAAAVDEVFREIDRLEQNRFAEPRVEWIEWFALPLLSGVLLLVFVYAWGRSLEAVEDVGGLGEGCDQERWIEERSEDFASGDRAELRPNVLSASQSASLDREARA
jgi:Ca-activated chloride channel family protein